MKIYHCPMHKGVQQNEPGSCSVCSMQLVKQNNLSPSVAIEKSDYTPLVVICGVISVVVSVLAFQSSLVGLFSWHEVMIHFMAGLFIVFAGFKLLDLRGFAASYATYDLIAQRIYAYGYVYPFLELGLGLLYLGGISTITLNLFTFVLMTVNGAGVLTKLVRKETFQCACLGTFLKVPLTKISLIEDFGMAIMAIAMLIM